MIQQDSHKWSTGNKLDCGEICKEKEIYGGNYLASEFKEENLLPNKEL